MGFLAPWFLAGLAALTLPVFVHLLRRQTTVPRPVSSLMFFERGTQSSIRHRRLRYLLLFALRALLLLLLALAFAKPFFRHKNVAASDRLMLVVIDDSFSMNATESGGTRLDEAKRQALSLLAQRPGRQKAQVIALGGQMRVLTQPVEDSAVLRAAVESIAPADGHGSFGELGRGIRGIAETVHTPIELDLFSDMQESNMPANFADLVMPGNVSLVLHRIGTGAPANWTVESVQAPAQLVDTKKSRVVAVVAGNHTPAATRTASLLVNGKVIATKPVNVPANGHATVAFEGLDVPYGESRCAVRIDGQDSFPQDDTSYFAVKRADPERVLFVHQASDARSPLYFGAALGAAAQASFVLQPITPEQAADVDPTKYAFVVLSDVPAIPSVLEHTLTRNVDAGGSVLIAEGLSAAQGERVPIFDERVGESHFYSRSGKGPGYAPVGELDLSHPALKDSAGWQSTKLFYAAAVEPGNSRVIARVADGSPLLLDKQIGEGHVLLFASGFDNITNNLPLTPAYVAFVDEAARYLAGEERMSGARVVDSYVQLRNPVNAGSSAAKTSVDVIAPDGSRPLSLRDAAVAQSFQLTRAGFYQVRFANGRDALIAVNPNRRESDLQPVAEDTLRLWSGSAAGQPEAPGQSSAQEDQSQMPANSHMWWWIMLLLALTGIAETALASRYLGTEREAL